MLYGHDCIHIPHDALVDHRTCLGVQRPQFAKIARRIIDRLIERGHIDPVN